MRMWIQTLLAKITTRGALLLAALFSAAMLGSALVAQYGFNLHPCELCIAQRYPYALIIILGPGAAFGLQPGRLQRYALWAVALLFITDAGIAFYHSGVELGWFPAPDACSSNSVPGQTLEEMRQAIMEAPLVHCDQAMVHIFGLSLAAWNSIAAMIAGVLTIYLARKSAHDVA